MSRPYELRGFLEAHEDWVTREDPSTDLSYLVLEWVFSRAEDPYQGARREPGFDNLWLAPVPRTRHDGRIVVCSFWIEEQAGAVRCDIIASLSPPI